MGIEKIIDECLMSAKTRRSFTVEDVEETRTIIRSAILRAQREAVEQSVQADSALCAVCGGKEFYSNERRTCVRCKTPSR